MYGIIHHKNKINYIYISYLFSKIASAFLKVTYVSNDL